MSSISIRRFIPAIIPALVLAATVAPVAVQPVAATDGSTFVSVVNRYRANAGVRPVSLHSVIDRISVERGNQLAAARKLSHDFDYLKARLDQENICWQQLGEIVAYNTASPETRVERFMQQWYNSDPHRVIMLGSGYTHAGGSWKTGTDGRHYGVMVFVKLCGATAPALAPAPSTTGTFTDIATSKFKADILWLAGEGITAGCAPDRFCPKGTVLRDQMATFLTRALGLGVPSKDFFWDDRTNKHEDRINRAATYGVTNGCDPGKYCPAGKVTRAQMASFLARALDLPRTNRDYFWDDNSSIHEDAINRMAAAGITSGCASGRFCPSGIVLREQMAAFLHRALD